MSSNGSPLPDSSQKIRVPSLSTYGRPISLSHGRARLRTRTRALRPVFLERPSPGQPDCYGDGSRCRLPDERRGGTIARILRRMAAPESE
jgi:hypothetical protein